eukprot:Sspe_Gene.11583::Locus_3932_Transcript_1_1_Confidence_1.000_Length_2431::g.11583::m.11583
MSFQAVQGLLGELPKITSESLEAKIVLDTTGITGAIMALYQALQRQASIIAAMENENSKRKMEMDIAMRSMKNDIQADLAGEAKRRAAEDDKLRREQREFQAGLEGWKEKIKELITESVQEVRKEMDTEVMKVRAAVQSAVAKVGQAQKELQVVSQQQRELSQLVTDHHQVAQSQHKNTQQSIDQIYSLLCVSKEEVVGAVRNNKQKDLFHQTPPFKSLIAVDRELESRLDELSKALTSTSRNLAVAESRITNNEGSLNVARSVMDENKTDLQRKIDEVVKATLVRESDLDARKAEVGTVKLKADKTDVKHLEREIQEIKDSLDSKTRGAEVEREVLARELQKKADWEALLEKADKEDLQGQLKELAASIREVEEELQDVRQSMTRPTQSVFQPPSRSESQMDKGKEEKGDDVSNLNPQLLSHVDATLPSSTLIEGLADKLSQIDYDLRLLQKDKVNKNDLHNLLSSFPHQSEQQSGDTYIHFTQTRSDSTAVRFRCLSCNRAAGPLSAMKDETQRSEFPPSTVRTYTDTRTPITKTPPKARPASPAAGGVVGTARKKLLSYYEWLRLREEERAQYQQPPNWIEDKADEDVPSPRSGGGVSPRRTPSPVWDGAQPGGGTPGTRQCGDHGSTAPGGIGSDGKFYDGVRQTEQAREAEEIRTAHATTFVSADQKIPTRPLSAKRCWVGGSPRSSSPFCISLPTSSPRRLAGRGSKSDFR